MSVDIGMFIFCSCLINCIPSVIEYYYRFARHCGILTLFYRAIFNGLWASNENSGPNVTFEPAKLGFK